MKTGFQDWLVRLIVAVPLTAFLCNPPEVKAGLLGTATNFAVVGGAAVSTTGVTTVTGDLGIWPGSAAEFTNAGVFNHTGSSFFGPGPGVAMTAQDDIGIAYTALAAMGVTTDLTGQDLGSVGPLLPGVYFFSSSAGLTGALTLDANNDPKAMFVFQIVSTLTTASASVVNVINGGAGVGVFWQVGSSATLGAGTAFLGNILAQTSITMNAAASICGRALAREGAVTMIGNTITNTCEASLSFNDSVGDFGSSGFAGEAAAAVPEPGTVTLLGAGLLALTYGQWKSRKRRA